jgi:predicted DCC family thiol-disulfide oxidoreductase YuxK
MENQHLPERLDVLYNDTCPICAREIAQYRKQAERVGAPFGFHALDSAGDMGLCPDAAAQRLHVRQGGRVLAGVDAFAALWSVLPRWRWLARLVRLPGVGWVAALAYDRIAAPLLYRAHLRRQARRQSSDKTAA